MPSASKLKTVENKTPRKRDPAQGRSMITFKVRLAAGIYKIQNLDMSETESRMFFT